jgi:hypothetical protein
MSKVTLVRAPTDQAAEKQQQRKRQGICELTLDFVKWVEKKKDLVMERAPSMHSA